MVTVVEVVVAVVPVVTVVGGAEEAACAGVITESTIGFVHLPGNMTAVATPPIATVVITCLRLMFFLLPSDMDYPLLKSCGFVTNAPKPLTLGNIAWGTRQVRNLVVRDESPCRQPKWLTGDALALELPDEITIRE